MLIHLITYINTSEHGEVAPHFHPTTDVQSYVETSNHYDMATVTFHNPWCENAMQARPCRRETHASRGYAYANEATVSLTDLPVLLVAAGTLSCIMHKGHHAEAE